MKSNPDAKIFFVQTVSPNSPHQQQKFAGDWDDGHLFTIIPLKETQNIHNHCRLCPARDPFNSIMFCFGMRWGEAEINVDALNRSKDSAVEEIKNVCRFNITGVVTADV